MEIKKEIIIQVWLKSIYSEMCSLPTREWNFNSLIFNKNTHNQHKKVSWIQFFVNFISNLCTFFVKFLLLIVGNRLM